MKSGKIIMLVVGVLILIGIIYLVVQSMKKANIKNAAVASGISPTTATAVANSSNPEAALRALGISQSSASLIASGTSSSTGTGNAPVGGRLILVGNSGSGLCPHGQWNIGPQANGSYDCYIQVAAAG